jgi:hypothetical protein
LSIGVCSFNWNYCILKYIYNYFLSVCLYNNYCPAQNRHRLYAIWREDYRPTQKSGIKLQYTILIGYLSWHTSKPGPDSDTDPDSDSKKIRTREKPGPGLEKNPDSCLTKPGFDFWKPGLEIDKTGFKTRTLCTRMQRFFGKV